MNQDCNLTEPIRTESKINDFEDLWCAKAVLRKLNQIEFIEINSLQIEHCDIMKYCTLAINIRHDWQSMMVSCIAVVLITNKDGFCTALLFLHRCRYRRHFFKIVSVPRYQYNIL